MATFAVRLKELRKKNNLTQKELAEKIGVSMQSVSLWERGPRKPDFGTLDSIADFFHVRLNYLLGASDDDSPPPVPTDEELGRWVIEEDDQELWSMAVRMCQLSKDMRSVVRSCIATAYRIDRANNNIVPVKDHLVSIRSTVLLKEGHEEDDEDEVYIK